MTVRLCVSLLTLSLVYQVQELESGSDQLEKLVEQLGKLKTENTSLRDRNDELTVQVENLSARVIYKRLGDIRLFHPLLHVLFKIFHLR